MAKVLVEIDIQAGLPEILEIEWRGILIAQRLDYLGIPFRCSYCHRTGHLRRDCSQFPPTVTEMDPSEEIGFDSYVTQPDQMGEEAPHLRRDTSFDPPDDSLVGKIKLHCPSLYNTLSAWDKLTINSLATNILHPELLESVSFKLDPPLHLPPLRLVMSPLATPLQLGNR
jgi:hypothetical protein